MSNNISEKLSQVLELETKSKFADVIVLCEQIAILFEKEGYFSNLIYVLCSKSRALAKLNKTEEALMNGEECLVKSEKYISKACVETIRACNTIADIYFDISDINSALKYFTKSVDISLQIPNISIDEIGSANNNLGICFFRKGDYDKAFEYFQKGLDMFRQVLDEEDPEIASSYLNIGIYYSIKGDFEQALKYFHHALNLLLKKIGEKNHKVSIAYNNIGSCYNETKDYDNALQNFEKALSIRIAISGEQNLYCSRICENMGIIYIGKNNKSKALECLNRALDICCNTIGEQHQEVVNIYKNIALCYDPDSKEKLLYLQKSLAIALKTFDDVHQEKASVYIEIGNYYNTKQNYPQALQNYQLALQSLNLPVSDTHFYALPTLKNYTHAYFLLETLRCKAIVFYGMYKQDNLPQNLIASLAHYHCADALITQMRQSYKTEGSKLILANTGKNNIYKPAIKLAWLAYQQETKNNLSVAQIAIQMGYQLPTIVELAFLFSEKSQAMLLFSNLKNEEAKAAAQLPEQLRQQEYQLRVELNYLDTKIVEENEETPENQNHEQLQKWQKQHFDYKQQYDQLIETFEKEYPDYYQIKYDNQIVTIEQIQRQLPTNAALIEYFVSNEQLYVFCITQNNSHFIALDTNQTTLNTAVQVLLKAITNSRPTVGGRNAFANASYQLYQLVFEPIVPHLPPNCQQLIIIPTAYLSQLPFEALLTNAVANGTHYHNMPYLGTQYATQYHYSATLWHYGTTKQKTTPAQPNAAQGSYLGFAPVVYNTALQTNHNNDIKKEAVLLRGLDYVALPHTETEIQEVSKLLAQNGYQSNVYLRKNATVEQFKNTLQQYPNLQFLHIAAHGVFNANNPQLSGIVFSPNANEDVLTDTAEQPIAATKRGIAEQYGTMLYMGDTYQLNLKNVQLVVLSCCDTGLGEMASGEGMMAINRGFLYAGAQNVVFTLFKIPDQQSNLLVQALFKYLLSGQSYAAALKNAKQEILTQPNIRPIHWAGFVLLGNNPS